MSSKSKKGPRALRPVPQDPGIAAFLKGDNVPVPRGLLQGILDYMNTRPRAECNRGATMLEVLLSKFPAKAPPGPAPSPAPETAPASEPEKPDKE
jgi:hypothetical protein